MINSLGQFNPLASQGLPLARADQLARADKFSTTDGAKEAGALGGAHQFGDMFTNLIGEVDSVRQHAAAETQKVMLGKTDSVHNAVISLQESSIALSMMVEVRNKLVESYQELMRMPV